MKNDTVSISNKTYTLKETENEDQLCFFRNDGGILHNIGQKPIEFYYVYLVKKLLNKQISNNIECKVSFELTGNNKYAIVNVEPIEKKPIIEKRKMSILKRIYWRFLW